MNHADKKSLINIILFILGIVIFSVVLIALLPKKIDSRWYWQRDYSGHVDSCYYELSYYDNDTQSESRYCAASNDTLYVLYPYNGTELSKFRHVVKVYEKTNNTLDWDWYDYMLNPISPLSPLNPIHTD